MRRLASNSQIRPRTSIWRSTTATTTEREKGGGRMGDRRKLLFPLLLQAIAKKATTVQGQESKERENVLLRTTIIRLTALS